MMLRRKKKKKKYSKGGDFAQAVLPAVGTIAGMAIGGPAGAMVGGGIGQILGTGVGMLDKDKVDPVVPIQPKGMPVSPGYASRGVDIRSFAKGGLVTPQYEVEDGEIIEGSNVALEKGKGRMLSSNFAEVGGNKHSKGGTEGAGGERVYSDQIRVTPNTLATVSNMIGLSTKKNSTVADLQKKIASIAGKSEKLMSKHKDKISLTTGKRNLELTNKASEMIFQDQEMQKRPLIEFDTPEELENYINNTPKKQFNTPEELENYINKTPSELKQLPPVNFDTNEEYMEYINKTPSGLNRDKGRNRPIFKRGGKLPKYADGYGQVGLGTRSKEGEDEGGKTDWMGLAQTAIPAIASGMQYLSNKKAIDGIQTDTPVVQQSAPQLGYTDLSGRLVRSNRQGAVNMMGMLRNSGRDTVQAAQSIYAQNLAADGNALTQEAGRRDGIGAAQGSINANVGSLNTQLINRELQDRTANRLFKTRQNINNQNNLTQSIIGQINQSQLRQLDKDKLLILSRQYESSGTGVRFEEWLQQTSPELYNKYITQVKS